jgi:hypothetical protein
MSAMLGYDQSTSPIHGMCFQLLEHFRGASWNRFAVQENAAARKLIPWVAGSGPWFLSRIFAFSEDLAKIQERVHWS